MNIHNQKNKNVTMFREYYKHYKISVAKGKKNPSSKWINNMINESKYKIT